MRRALDRAREPETVNSAAAMPRSQVFSEAFRGLRSKAGKTASSRVMIRRPTAWPKYTARLAPTVRA